MRTGLPGWAAARRAEGYDLRWAKASVRGFPFAFHLHVTQVTLAANKPVPTLASAAQIVAAARPWNLRSWRFTAPQGLELTLRDTRATLVAAEVEGEAAPAADGSAEIALRAHDIRGRDAAQGLGAALAEAAITLPAQAPASHDDAALVLTAKLQDVMLPAAVPPMGAELQSLTLAATLKGRLRSGPLAEALAAWSDDGGVLEIDEASFAWGRLKGKLNGTLALDGQLQPIGALSAQLTGADTIVDAAAAAGALQEPFAHLAKSALRVISQPGADGEDSVRLPVTLQDGKVFLGPAPIAPLPRFSWR